MPTEVTPLSPKWKACMADRCGKGRLHPKEMETTATHWSQCLTRHSTTPMGGPLLVSRCIAAGFNYSTYGLAPLDTCSKQPLLAAATSSTVMRCNTPTCKHNNSMCLLCFHKEHPRSTFEYDHDRWHRRCSSTMAWWASVLLI